jgi:hypothetical protein
VIRAARLAPSRPMYAFNPDMWRQRRLYRTHTVDAVWFKRKGGQLVAVMGTYSPLVLRRDQEPADASYEAWIAAADDNRYGGSHLASWDGTALLCSDQPVPPDVTAERVAFLDTMLRGFPDPPAGFDGWWTFPKRGTR